MITYKYLIKYIALIPFHNFTTLSGKLKMVFTAIPITQMLVCSWNSFVSACKDFPKSYFLTFYNNFKHSNVSLYKEFIC